MGKGGTFNHGCAPVLLRLMLGVTFLWAGAGKVLKEQAYSGADAAALANMGMNLTPARASTPPAPAPTTTDTTTGTGASPVLPPPDRILPMPGSKEPEAKPASPSRRPGGKTVGLAPDPLGNSAATAVTQTAAPGAGGRYTAEDFAKPIELSRVYGLAVTMNKAALGVGSDGKPVSAFWPGWLGTNAMPIYLAWAVALTELVAGLGLLVGLFTRWWAICVAGVMIGAMWLTELGPAWASGSNVLGFIPNYDWWDPKLWSRPLWQLSLLTASVVLVMLGSGHGSFDRALAAGKAKKAAGGDEEEE